QPGSTLPSFIRGSERHPSGGPPSPPTTAHGAVLRIAVTATRSMAHRIGIISRTAGRSCGRVTVCRTVRLDAPASRHYLDARSLPCPLPGGGADGEVQVAPGRLPAPGMPQPEAAVGRP